MMKRIFFLSVTVCFILIAILLVNYFSVRSLQVNVLPAEQLKVSDTAITRLSRAIQIPTVSGQFRPALFISFLKRHFATLHQRLEVKIINNGGLVLHWRAKASQHKPILLLAHYDVVPATEQGWQYPPFSGHIDDNYVWGRGTMDDKSSLMAMLEAIDLLLTSGYQPNRDIYLAFGHDEETGGQQGAAHIAQFFAQQNIQFDYVLDEGMVIADGILTFVDKPVALIGIAEKGYADIELSLAGEGGHASMPGRQTLLGDLSTAVSQLQLKPLAAQITEPTRQMLMTLAPESNVISRLSFSNLWLFKPLIMRKFEALPATHAVVHTTIAATQMFASDKVNVLPHRVSAMINVRILPGSTSQQVIDHIREVVADARIEIRLMQATEPSGIASTTSAAYAQLSQSIRQVFPDALVAPGLVIPATDSRHYRNMAQETYRFMPIIVNKLDLTRFHGRNERIAKEAYRKIIRFYYQCIINSTSRALFT